MHKPNNPNLYLRKYLVCPICGHRITGATSKGHGGQYDYYCCNHDHKHLNIRAERANKIFVQYISELTPNKAVVALYKEILADARGTLKHDRKDRIGKLEEEIQTLTGRVNRVNDLYFDGELSKADRDEQVQRYKDSIHNIETRIKALQASEELNIKEKVDYCVNIVENLDHYFTNASAETKIRLLGSIFNEEIEFDGEKYRTSNFNSMLGYIYQNANELQGQTETDSPDFSGKSALVAPRGIEPRFKV
ncbi:MAG: zinc ribbon domain-containing protein [Bacteroidales bacterium]|nr:zinc ribbon domain-containing protein [Bacteroidales bacterium]